MSGFNDIEKALKDAIETGFRDQASGLQRLFDRLGSELEGQPLDTAKLRLKEELVNNGGSPTDEELTEYSTALVEGRRVILDVKPVHW